MERVITGRSHIGSGKSSDALSTNHPMTGNNHGKPIGTARLAYRTRTAAQQPRDGAIGTHLATRYLPNDVPDPMLVSGSQRCEGQIETRVRIVKVTRNLSTHTCRQSVCRRDFLKTRRKIDQFAQHAVGNAYSNGAKGRAYHRTKAKIRKMLCVHYAVRSLFHRAGEWRAAVSIDARR